VYARTMDVTEAARRWAETWERAWPAKDAEAIAALYDDGAIYRSHPIRQPEPGGALGYLRRQFDTENSIECRFGTPIAAGVECTHSAPFLTLPIGVLATVDDEELVVEEAAVS